MSIRPKRSRWSGTIEARSSGPLQPLKHTPIHPTRSRSPASTAVRRASLLEQPKRSNCCYSKGNHWRGTTSTPPGGPVQPHTCKPVRPKGTHFPGTTSARQDGRCGGCATGQSPPSPSVSYTPLDHLEVASFSRSRRRLPVPTAPVRLEKKYLSGTSFAPRATIDYAPFEHLEVSSAGSRIGSNIVPRANIGTAPL